MGKDIVGFIVALRHSKILGFISSFVILKKFRRQGYGKSLFTHALEHLEERQVTLECIKNQESMYKPYGFRAYYKVKHYKYTIDKHINPPIFNTTNVTVSYKAEEILVYNTKIFSLKFAKYMQRIIEDKETSFQALYTDNKVLSYGISTQYKDGYKLTLFANNLEELRILFFKLIYRLSSSSTIYIEVADTEKALLELVDLLKMQEHSSMQKMYNKIL